MNEIHGQHRRRVMELLLKAENRAREIALQDHGQMTPEELVCKILNQVSYEFSNKYDR